MNERRKDSKEQRQQQLQIQKLLLWWALACTNINHTEKDMKKGSSECTKIIYGFGTVERFRRPAWIRRESHILCGSIQHNTVQIHVISDKRRLNISKTGKVKAGCFVAVHFMY